ncbi:MAG: DUF2304 domain-containing protein [Candidatus Falkowbacteria bacterium]
MIQQILALLVIAFFVSRLFWQKRKKQISGGEFLFWLIFWIMAAMSVLFLRKIDALVAGLGFSGSGIEVLLYMAVAILFYFIFRLRLRLEKIEKNITLIIREMAHINYKQNDH